MGRTTRRSASSAGPAPKTGESVTPVVAVTKVVKKGKVTVAKAASDASATGGGGGSGSESTTDGGGKHFWLMKSEPNPRMERGVDVSYSIDAFIKDGVADWDGVRNYTARNFMRDDMKIGDEVLYYHSSCKQPGVVGIAKVVREGYPDECAWDPKDPHYDPKTDPKNPRWFKVDIEFVRRTRRLIGLAEMKTESALTQMALFTKARLSVSPVTPAEWDHIMDMEGRDAPEPAPKKKRMSGKTGEESKPKKKR